VAFTNFSGDVESLQGLTNYARPFPDIIDSLLRDRPVEKLRRGECTHLAKGILTFRSIRRE
jgi:hypothetical protein